MKRARARLVSVSKLRRSDLKPLLMIAEGSFARPWSAALFRSELTNPDRLYFAARAKRRLSRPILVGFAGAVIAAGEAQVTTVAVAPASRRQGVGAQLVHATLLAARERGCFSATLEVRAKDRSAQRLYRRFGFVEAGVRPRYYADDYDDAVVMWLNNLDDPAMPGRLDASLASVGARS